MEATIMLGQNTDLTYEICDQLSALLSTHDMSRLISCVRATRFSEHRRLYRRTVGATTDPNARKLARSQVQQWLKRSDLETQIYRALDAIAESIEHHADGSLTGTDHAQMTDDIFLGEALDHIQRITGISKIGDPIVSNCCHVVFQLLGGLPIDDLTERLAQINSERAQLNYFKGRRVHMSLVV